MSSNNDPNSSADTPPSDAVSRLQQWFEAAVELSTEERKAWLINNISDEDERATVRRLLAADDEASFLDMPVGERIARLAAIEIQPEGLIGQHVGEFRLVRALGQGGMAAVFLAERIDRDFHHRVAVKLLQRGLYSELEQRLFQRERQVLAALEHPNIAHLIDGGVTQAGIPYLVMEFVDGVPITEYVQAHDLDIPQRLKLFLDVCRAVETAHRNLIVHRDIKPSNILVTESGEVKLLDFGIAKLLQEDAEGATSTVGVFTPGYAAPEQVSGGIMTTATDVYGLGVLLHELLLGLKPETNADNDPRRPSSRVDAFENIASGDSDAKIAKKYTREQLRRLLRGDLDNIILKALEAEPERRYASAGAFAEDIDRYLDGRPVVAHPPTRWYTAKKFITRHRSSVTVTVILAAAVLVALGATLWEARAARQQAKLAHAEAIKAKQISDFITQMLTNVDPNRAKAMDRSLIRLILDSAAKNAANETSSEPAVRTSIEELIATTYYSIGEYDLAEIHSQSALDAALKAHAELGTQVRLMAKRSDALYYRAQYQEADKLAEQAVSIASVLPEDNQDRLFAETSLAFRDCSLLRLDSCSKRLMRLYAIERRTLGESAPETLGALGGLVNSDLNSRRYAEGKPLAEEFLGHIRKRYGDDDSRTLEATRVLAMFDFRLQEYAEAEELLVPSLGVAERVLGDEHPITADTMYWLGNDLFRQRRYAEAKPLLERSLIALTKNFGPNYFETLSAESVLVRTLLNLNDIASAESHAQALASRMKLISGGHGDHGLSQTLLAEVFIQKKLYTEAEQKLNEAYALEMQAARSNDNLPLDVVKDYVSLYTAWGKPDLASQWKQKLDAAANKTPPSS